MNHIQLISICEKLGPKHGGGNRYVIPHAKSWGDISLYLPSPIPHPPIPLMIYVTDAVNSMINLILNK